MQYVHGVQQCTCTEGDRSICQSSGLSPFLSFSCNTDSARIWASTCAFVHKALSPLSIGWIGAWKLVNSLSRASERLNSLIPHGVGWSDWLYICVLVRCSLIVLYIRLCEDQPKVHRKHVALAIIGVRGDVSNERDRDSNSRRTWLWTRCDAPSWLALYLVHVLNVVRYTYTDTEASFFNPKTTRLSRLLCGFSLGA